MSEIAIDIDCASVKAKLDSGEEFLLLDCRQPDEYETASIAGATLLPMGEIAERVSELDSHRDQLIVVHCHHGGRSLRVTHWLRQQGFAAVQNMAGGIDHWSQTVDTSVPRY